MCSNSFSNYSGNVYLLTKGVKYNFLQGSINRFRQYTNNLRILSFPQLLLILNCSFVIHISLAYFENVVTFIIFPRYCNEEQFKIRTGCPPTWSQKIRIKEKRRNFRHRALPITWPHASHQASVGKIARMLPQTTRLFYRLLKHTVKLRGPILRTTDNLLWFNLFLSLVFHWCQKRVLGGMNMRHLNLLLLQKTHRQARRITV